MKSRFSVPIASMFCACMSLGALWAGSPEAPVHASGLHHWLSGDYLTGDWGGMRTKLADKGVEFGLTYYAEVWGNTTGGMKDGAVYTGLGQIETMVDLEKLAGWKGGSMYSRWLWLSGRDASADLAGNFFTVSNIAGFNTFRNIEMWFQQTLWDEKISLRAGQLAADSEFIISNYGALFLNGTFGWPAFIYTNIPNGGPGYPMGAPGVRLSFTPVEPLTVMAAVFQGDVFPQNVNRHGFRWRLNSQEGYLWLTEAQYQHEFWLPGTIKAGAWFDSGNFASAADPDQVLWGNYGIYFIADQMLYREPAAGEAGGSTKDGKTCAAKNSAGASPASSQGLGAFARLAFSPADRNFLGFYVDTGLTYQGLLPSRDSDTAGIAFAYGQLTNGTKDILAAENEANPGYEIVIEATYQAQITPWLAIQPDAQFILHPGGSTRLDNAFVIGGRATITF